MNGLTSQVMVSNLITMGLCADKDKRQAVGDPYTLPSEETRLLRAKVILEEALETINGLGVHLSLRGTFAVENGIDDFTLRIGRPYDLEKIIDGCCDVIYVATGTLASCGVPDVPHLQEVCQANLDKFPGGVATFREDGKFLKPEGWEPPDHASVQNAVIKHIPIKQMAFHHVAGFKRGKLPKE